MNLPAQEALKRASTQLALWGISDTKLSSAMRRELTRFFASAKIRVLGTRGIEARNVFTAVALFSQDLLPARVAGAALARSMKTLYARERELIETNAYRFRPQAFSGMTRDELFRRLAGTVNELPPTGFELAQAALWMRELDTDHHDHLKELMAGVATGTNTVRDVKAAFRSVTALSDPVFTL